jgi:hypothetical protein
MVEVRLGDGRLEVVRVDEAAATRLRRATWGELLRLGILA